MHTRKQHCKLLVLGCYPPNKRCPAAHLFACVQYGVEMIIEDGTMMCSAMLGHQFLQDFFGERRSKPAASGCDLILWGLAVVLREGLLATARNHL